MNISRQDTFLAGFSIYKTSLNINSNSPIRQNTTKLNYKNDGFIARMIILFVFLRYRNIHYGNKHYDKVYRYEIF